ncbi:uncharacterized protein [Nothobranchius furzeri]|uniref:uncharacterized protein n=1 Tax=Nothobranchius furzeri TaxID=105023 RepID=UPI0039048958
MGAFRSSSGLLLSVAGIVFVLSLVSVKSNTTQGPGFLTTGESIASTPSNSFQESCQGGYLQNNSQSITASVDIFLGELLCKNDGLPQNVSVEVEQNLKLIVELSLKVYLKLVNNGTGVLEAFGVLNSLNLGNLSDPTFVQLWFSLKMAPFLPYISQSFLIQLGNENFSCSSFQKLIVAFSIERWFIQSKQQQAVYTHFIKSFLSRKDLPDPGCVSSVNDSQQWLQANFGSFSSFATIQDLQVFNPNFSINVILTQLAPSQVAELLLSSNITVDVNLINQVFDRLVAGNALENVDEFLTKLTTEGQVPQFQPVVRDRMMNRTFDIISPHFISFQRKDYSLWFRVKLFPILASFTPEMLQNVTSTINCTNYQIIVSGMADVSSAMPQYRQQEIAAVLLSYMTKSVNIINQPVCRQNGESDAVWIKTNLGPFAEYVTYSKLQIFNLSQEAVLGVLSPQEKVQLLLDPKSGALKDPTLVKAVLSNLTESGSVEQLRQFFQTFAEVTLQENITFIKDPSVRETILNVTLTALAPEFDNFTTHDFVLWFQIYLRPVIASLQPDSLQVIPNNISCDAYSAIVDALENSLTFLPLVISMDVRSSLESMQINFPICAAKDSFVCKETQVVETLICAAVDSSQVQQTLATDNSSLTKCTFDITEIACSLPSNLTQDKAVILLQCSLKEQTTYPVEVWKLFFQRTSGLDQALELFRTTALNSSKVILTNALEALGEIQRNKVTQQELQNKDFVHSWFQKISPFLASTSDNFLICLSGKNFSCPTYQIVIETLNNQKASMDNKQQQAVYTHFIKSFLSRKDLPDPGCVSSVNDSQQWLQANFGSFSSFATIQDLQVLNQNFSINVTLSQLAPSQVAELLLSSNITVDVNLINQVFERLAAGNALENVDEFLTQLTAEGQVPQFQPVVRDRMMNRTFDIISPHFISFQRNDYSLWFRVKLLPILASFTPEMLQNVTSTINCTNYQIIVSGMADVSSAMPQYRQQEIAAVLLSYMTKSVNIINQPVCRPNGESDAVWIETNLGPFAEYVTYSKLQIFNLSQEAVLGVLSPQEKVQLLLDPKSGALKDPTLVKAVLSNLTESGSVEQLRQFFQTFAEVTLQENITFIKDPSVRETILNVTLTALAPEFDNFTTHDFVLWFQIYLRPVIASLQPDSLQVIPNNISCDAYSAIVDALENSLTFLPLVISMDVRSSLESMQINFPICAAKDSFVCKETQVVETLICAAVDSSQVQQTLATDNSSLTKCTFDITEIACSLPSNLTQDKAVILLQCSLKEQTTYPVEVWKLFFQRTSGLDQALELFRTTVNSPTQTISTCWQFLFAYSISDSFFLKRQALNSSKVILTNALEALGEIQRNKVTQQELQNKDFVHSWFQKISPFLASTSDNFLICLSGKNFSCPTYQIVIETLNNQKASMDNKQQQAVYTHFIKSFLSRKDLPDPGCVSSVNDSQQWLQANFGSFSSFATIQDLQVLNQNFSINVTLSQLAPSQVAELLLSSNITVDVNLINQVFERLAAGNALENVDEFLTQLTAEGQVPQFQPVVRDRMMNRTFDIISPHFISFQRNDYSLWFRVKLLPILASFTPEMLQNVTSTINCTNYQIIVSGMADVSSAMPQYRQQEIAAVLLSYMTKSVNIINQPVCRPNGESDAVWIETNLGPFAEYVTYSKLQIFNLSQEAVLGVLSPQEKVQLLLDPKSGALKDPTLVKAVLSNLTESGSVEQLRQFFQTFAEVTLQENITFIKDPSVRETILNVTLTALAPEFDNFTTHDFVLWFQIYLRPVIASLQPDSLQVIPNNISCDAYSAIVDALENSLTFLPLVISMDVRSSLESMQINFPICAAKDSFVCKETQDVETLICAAVDSSQVQQTLATDNSSLTKCTFDITEIACSLPSNLTQDKAVILLQCSLKEQTTYPVEVWKLFFQRTSGLDQALELFRTTVNSPTQTISTCWQFLFAYSISDSFFLKRQALNSSKVILTNALEALGEIQRNKVTQQELQNKDFVHSWFQKISPFLASTSDNFLICLSGKNFSCPTYQIVIETLNNQKASMDNKQQQAVYTHFIKSFLSRKDLPDPGCVSSVNDSQQWLQANFGSFSSFATIQDLQVLNQNFSINVTLSQLAPSQVAELLLSSNITVDVNLINQVFERLAAGNALENVDEFLTQLTAEGQVGYTLKQQIKSLYNTEIFKQMKPQTIYTSSKLLITTYLLRRCFTTY